MDNEACERGGGAIERGNLRLNRRGRKFGITRRERYSFTGKCSEKSRAFASTSEPLVLVQYQLSRLR